MVVPCLAHHLQWHTKSHQGCQGGCRKALRLAFAAFLAIFHLIECHHQQAPQSCHAHTYPDGEGVERTRKRVVAFAWLARGLVKIDYNGKSCHKEQEEYYPELLDAAFAGIGLPQQAHQTEQQRQHIEHVAALVACTEVIGKQTLVAKTQIIDKWYAAYPVAVVYLSLCRDVVLASGKVPHKVAPIHVVDLIIEEELQIFDKCRLYLILGGYHIAIAVEACSGFYIGAGHAGPLAIFVGMCSTIHAREQHIEFGVGLILLRASGHLILLRRIAVVAYCLGIEGLAFLNHCAISAVAVLLIHYAGIECLSVEQRAVAILLSIEICGKREHVVGRVLIDWRMRI